LKTGGGSFYERDGESSDSSRDLWRPNADWGKTVKNIPWWEPEINDPEKRLVAKVLDSNFVNDGEVTTEFEDRIAKRIGCGYAVAVTSGTCAIYCALVALDIGPGDEVIVPDATFIATVNAVIMSGATPVLADIDPVALTLSPAAIVAAITPRTRAVMPVHVSGRAADMDAIVAIAEKHGIEVIEDAAEAFMSKVGGKYLGTIGRLGCFSFSPLKIITTGQGGLVVTDDERLHRRLREIKDQGRPVRSSGVDYDIPGIGYNFKLTNLQAAVGLGQLECLDWRMEQVRRVYRGYEQGLEGIDGITLPGFRIDEGELPLWTDVLAERRDELNEFLQARGMDCRKYWKPIHTQPCYAAADDRFPDTLDAMSRALWLPSSFNLTDDDVAAVSNAIREFYG